MSLFRRRPKVEDQSVLIRVYPVSPHGPALCRASPWGIEDYTHCPFLRDGFCTMYGFYVRQRPQKAADCPVRQVAVPIPPI